MRKAFSKQINNMIKRIALATKISEDEFYEFDDYDLGIIKKIICETCSDSENIMKIPADGCYRAYYDAAEHIEYHWWCCCKNCNRKQNCTETTFWYRDGHGIRLCHEKNRYNCDGNHKKHGICLSVQPINQNKRNHSSQYTLREYTSNLDPKSLVKWYENIDWPISFYYGR